MKNWIQKLENFIAGKWKWLEFIALLITPFSLFQLLIWKGRTNRSRITKISFSVGLFILSLLPLVFNFIENLGKYRESSSPILGVVNILIFGLIFSAYLGLLIAFIWTAFLIFKSIVYQKLFLSLLLQAVLLSLLSSFYFILFFVSVLTIPGVNF